MKTWNLRSISLNNLTILLNCIFAHKIHFQKKDTISYNIIPSLISPFDFLDDNSISHHVERIDPNVYIFQLL